MSQYLGDELVKKGLAKEEDFEFGFEAVMGKVRKGIPVPAAAGQR